MFFRISILPLLHPSYISSLNPAKVFHFCGKPIRFPFIVYTLLLQELYIEPLDLSTLIALAYYTYCLVISILINFISCYYSTH